MKALDLDKLDAFMEIEYDGEIYNAYTENDIDDKAINVIPITDNATNYDALKAVFGNITAFRIKDAMEFEEGFETWFFEPYKEIEND